MELLVLSLSLWILQSNTVDADSIIHIGKGVSSEIGGRVRGRGSGRMRCSKIQLRRCSPEMEKKKPDQ